MSMKKLKKSKVKVAKRGSVVDRIMPLSEMPDYSSTLLYGEGGTGKTALSATWPKPMLVLDIKERGTKTIKKVPGIQGVLITDWDEIEEMYWYLKDGKGAGKFKSISLDQVTEMQDRAIHKVRSEKNMKVGDKTSFKFWGDVSGLMKTWLGNFRDLQDDGTHVIFVAHQRTFGGEGEDEDNQIDPSVGARLMPSVASYLNGAVSTIGNTFIRERLVKEGNKKIRKVDYCLRVGPHAVYRSKIRRPPTAGMLPDIIVNPTFEKLEAVSRGEELSKPKIRSKK